MSNVKPQAYACIVNGAFEDVVRHKAVADQLVDAYAKDGVVVDILPLYTVDEVGLVTKVAELREAQHHIATAELESKIEFQNNELVAKQKYILNLERKLAEADARIAQVLSVAEKMRCAGGAQEFQYWFDELKSFLLRKQDTSTLDAALAAVRAEQCQRIKNLKARAHDHLALLGVERNRALKAEQERDALRAQLISEWDMDEIPTFRQGAPIHEMEGIVTAEQVTGYVKRIAELREQVRVLNEALTELMKYTPRTAYVGGPDNGYLRPAGTELLKVLDKCDAALAAVRESTSSHAGEGATVANLIQGKNYRWVGQKDVLTYIGKDWSGNGYWHQFEKADEPGKVWCEVTDQDIREFARFEEVSSGQEGGA